MIFKSLEEYAKDRNMTEEEYERAKTYIDRQVESCYYYMPETKIFKKFKVAGNDEQRIYLIIKGLEKLGIKFNKSYTKYKRG